MLTLSNDDTIFDGHFYFFHSFDIGDDIDFKMLHTKYKDLLADGIKLTLFKSYNKPLQLHRDKLELSHSCISASLYNFGGISLRYEYPFRAKLEQLKAIINESYDTAEKSSFSDAKIIFNAIKECINESRFFNLNCSYTVIQITPKHNLTPHAFKEQYGNEIASVLQFETEHLSEYKKDMVLSQAIGYYRGDLLIIDASSTLAYDAEYHDILDIFEFSNMRHMELQFFDRALDKQLNFTYERKPYKVPFITYLPIFGMLTFNPIEELAKLRVDISVVLERLWSTVKFSDEPYLNEIYAILSEKLMFNSWQLSIDKKLEVIRYILETHEHKINNIRHDILNILIFILIFIEVVFATITHFR